jgi:hypothetical protein
MYEEKVAIPFEVGQVSTMEEERKQEIVAKLSQSLLK